MPAADLQGWVPIRLYWNRGEPFVDWCHLGDQRPTDPFWDHTIERRLRDPFCLLFRHQTPIEALVEEWRARPGPAPNGFIFHMSRCGSTLVAQMLAECPANIVISEAGIINTLLTGPSWTPLPIELRLTWLRALLSALATPRGAGEMGFVVKFDSWHTVHLPLIRMAFPEVPWIFLYRDPVEVLYSLGRLGGGRLVPGAVDPALLGPSPDDLAAMHPHDHHAAIVAAVCDTAIRAHDPPRSRLVNYRELPSVVWRQLPAFFALPHGQDDLERMKQRARRDGKIPRSAHHDDSQAKQEAASDQLRAAATRWLAPRFASLEQLHASQLRESD